MDLKDIGKESRKNYKMKHPYEDANIDLAYENGPDIALLDGITKEKLDALRKKWAERAIRYSRPANGYMNGDHHQGPVEGTPDPTKVKTDPNSEELVGGGVYKKSNPAGDKEVCDNVYHWVEDMFWPKNPETTGDKEYIKRISTVPGKLEGIDNGDLDIGKRLDPKKRDGFPCREQADLLAYLLRAAGYKVQYKNILPSQSVGETVGGATPTVLDIQTAAIDVWYKWGWHLYDPYESFSDDDGGLPAYTVQKGNIGCGGVGETFPITPYHDAYVFRWAKKDYEGFDWKAPSGEGTVEEAKRRMIAKGWELATSYSNAGASFRNRNESVRLGLSFGESWCGYLDSATLLSSLEGASYHAFDRKVGRGAEAEKDSPECVSARDEWVVFNLFEAGSFPLVLSVHNLSQDRAVPFDVIVYPSHTAYLGVKMPRRRLTGMLPPGGTQRIPVKLRAKQVGTKPIDPVRSVSAAALSPRRVLVQWAPNPNADRYLVYRRFSREIQTNDDLAKSKLVAKDVRCPCFEDRLTRAGAVFYAVLAADAKGRLSGLDVEESSTAVVQVGRRRSKGC